MEQRFKMKDLPQSERPYEKCLEQGPSVLSDAELLAVILRSGTTKYSALDIARELLHRYGRDRGLGFLMEAARSELEAVEGVGEVKATGLLCIGELSRRIARNRVNDAVILKGPEDIASCFMEDMCYLDREELFAAMFNSRNRLLHAELVSVGTVNASLASPREIFLAALRHQAVFLVILHNHPSGDPEPSREDIRLTEELVRAGDLLRIPVADHIVIGDHCWCSLRQKGLMPHSF